MSTPIFDRQAQESLVCTPLQHEKSPASDTAILSDSPMVPSTPQVRRVFSTTEPTLPPSRAFKPPAVALDAVKVRAPLEDLSPSSYHINRVSIPDDETKKETPKVVARRNQPPSAEQTPKDPIAASEVSTPDAEWEHDSNESTAIIESPYANPLSASSPYPLPSDAMHRLRQPHLLSRSLDSPITLNIFKTVHHAQPATFTPSFLKKCVSAFDVNGEPVAMPASPPKMKSSYRSTSPYTHVTALMIACVCLLIVSLSSDQFQSRKLFNDSLNTNQNHFLPSNSNGNGHLNGNGDGYIHLNGNGDGLNLDGFVAAAYDGPEEVALEGYVVPVVPDGKALGKVLQNVLKDLRDLPKKLINSARQLLYFVLGRIFQQSARLEE